LYGRPATRAPDPISRIRDRKSETAVDSSHVRPGASPRQKGIIGAAPFARVLPATRPAYTSRALVPGAVRDPRHGRLYVREGQAIVILGADGTILERLFGFRYAREQRIRG